MRRQTGGPISNIEWLSGIVPIFGRLGILPQRPKLGQGEVMARSGSDEVEERGASLLCAAPVAAIPAVGFLVYRLFLHKLHHKDRSLPQPGRSVAQERCQRIESSVNVTAKSDKDRKEATRESLSKRKSGEPLRSEKENRERESLEKLKTTDPEKGKQEYADSPNKKGVEQMKCQEKNIPKITISTCESVRDIDLETLKENEITKTADTAAILAKCNERFNEKTSRKRSTALVHMAQSAELNAEVGQVKAFKITKYPKTHTALVSGHGTYKDHVTQVVVVLAEKPESLNTSIQSAEADVNIEGANVSRLRITHIEDKGEEDKLVAKTVPIKEYMVYVANQLIEEAVRRVREDCSLDNIQHLALTIRKYRPESGQLRCVATV